MKKREKSEGKKREGEKGGRGEREGERRKAHRG